MSAALLAPAKVNLFLHVGAPGPDGYHPLASLMVFADIGDRLTFEAAQTQSMTIEGLYAAGLSAGADNLVMRAARAALAKAGRAGAGFHLILDKRLPVAGGLGGGSSDAGAALRLIDEGLGLGIGEADLQDIAAGLGADGAACFRSRPVLAQGRGERLAQAPAWPDLPCVLVNPGVLSRTRAVYDVFDAAGIFASVQPPPLENLDRVEDVVAVLGALRNDLEPPAVALEPAIGEALAALRARPDSLLARMSGSGGTCFVLCADDAAAQAMAAELFETRPDWWVRPCRLAGSRRRAK